MILTILFVIGLVTYHFNQDTTVAGFLHTYLCVAYLVLMAGIAVAGLAILALAL